MNNRAKPLAVAIATLLLSSMAHAEAVLEARQIIVDGDIVAAADTDGKITKRTIVTSNGSGSNQHFEIIGDGSEMILGDLDSVVSSAFAESFSPSMVFKGSKRVKNAPYSAEVISEKIQNLPDGNQISKKTAAATYRDSAGRTRQEVREANGELKSIQIYDAVEGTRYTLSPAKKSAVKMSMPADMAKHLEELQAKTKDLREKAKALVKDGKPGIVEHNENGDHIIIKRSDSTNADGKTEVREEVKVNVVRAGGNTTINGVNVGDIVTKAMGEATRSGPIAFSFQDMKWSAKSTTTTLGSKDFDGVRAEGKSVSYTIPAGEVGNKNPITVTTETWYSPDLQITVYSKHSDPRSGDTIYRLANIKRAEQPQTLFAPPADYAIKEMKGFSFHTRSEK